MRIKKLIQN